MGHLYKVYYMGGGQQKSVRMESPIYYSLENGKPVHKQMFNYDFQRFLEKKYENLAMWEAAELQRVDYDGYKI